MYWVCTFLVTGCGKSRVLQNICRLLKFPPTHLFTNEAFRLTAKTLLPEIDEKGIGTRCEQCSQNKNGEVLSPCFLEKSSLKMTEPSPNFLQHTLSFKAYCGPSTTNLIPCSSYMLNISKSLSELSLSLFTLQVVCNGLLSFFWEAVRVEDTVDTVLDEGAGALTIRDWSSSSRNWKW